MDPGCAAQTGRLGGNGIRVASAMRLPSLTTRAPIAHADHARAPIYRLQRQIDPVLSKPDQEVTFIHEVAPNLGAQPQVPRVDAIA